MNSIMQNHEAKDIKSALSNKGRLDLIDSKYATKKVGYRGWNYISKNMNNNETELWKYLYDMGSTKLKLCDTFLNKKGKCCGEEVYLDIRPKLKEYELIVIGKIHGPEMIEKESDKKQLNQKKVKSKNKQKKANNSANNIRKKNITAKINKDFEILFSILETENNRSDESNEELNEVSINSNLIELLFVKMMYSLKMITKKYNFVQKEYNSTKNSKYLTVDEIDDFKKNLQSLEKKINEMIIGFNKVMNEKINLYGVSDMTIYDNSKSRRTFASKCVTEPISKSCYIELQRWIDYAKHTVNFNTKSVTMNMPELLFKTSHDNMLEINEMKMYQSQMEIVKYIMENDSYIVLVHTMTNSGKTTLITSIAGLVEKTRSSSETKIIFCCPNNVVLLEVSRMLYGTCIPFAIVVKPTHVNVTESEYKEKLAKEEIDEDYVLEYKYSAFCDAKNRRKSCVVYVCDMFVAKILLEQRENKISRYNKYMRHHDFDPQQYPLLPNLVPSYPDYIFVGDELTKDADSQEGFMVESGFSITTEFFVNLMKLSPDKIILMSATLPTYEQLKPQYDLITNLHPKMYGSTKKMNLTSFTSSEAKIGCALISKNGNLFAPHSNCTTVSDLVTVLNVINSNPFIGRFYTFELLIKMVEINEKLNLPVPDLSEMHDDPTKANQLNIQKKAYEILQTVINTGDDSIVKSVCDLKIDGKQGVDVTKMLTYDIYKYSKGCLVFSSEPLTTALQFYEKNFECLTQNKDIFKQLNIVECLSQYDNDIVTWEKAMKRIDDKTDPGSNKINKTTGKKERSKTESWQVISNMVEQKPNWKFPKMFQLCSIEHLKKFGCNDKNVIVSGSVGPEDIPKDTSVSVQLLTLLASGIGVYSTKNPSLDEEYLKTVIFLAKSGVIKVLFTDNSIAYGTNLSISDIIIVDEPVMLPNGTLIPSIDDIHSMKTMFQMLSRAGRSGNLSYEAKIYTTSENDSLINKIRMYTRNMLDEGSKDEIVNIRNAFNILW